MFDEVLPVLSPPRRHALEVALLVDSGGTVHVVRNEGNVDLVTIVASLVPAGAARRIDEADPGNCPF